jgi:hypothetical protein
MCLLNLLDSFAEEFFLIMIAQCRSGNASRGEEWLRAATEGVVTQA